MLHLFGRHRRMYKEMLKEASSAVIRGMLDKASNTVIQGAFKKNY